VRSAGDAVVAAFFGADKPKKRKEIQARHFESLEQWIQKSDFTARKELQTAIECLNTHSANSPSVLPFHWEIEFPEVFTVDARDKVTGGFDAIVGNPPYAGKNTVIAGNREGYLDWLKLLHEESHGNADLVAHFFRRAFVLLRRDGTFGLIATNTIRQGDTRHTGLRWICVEGGGTIYAARRRYKWAGAAAVVVSVVWVVKGTLPAPFDLDGKSVPIITAYLFHDGGHENPALLKANAGRSFIGSYVLGMGFTFDDTDKKGVANPLAEMERLIANNPRNAERIFPYLGGDEVNDSPTHGHHRYVINFADFPLRRENLDGSSWVCADEEERKVWLRSGIVPNDYPEPVAEDWPQLLDVVERKVKGTRASHSTAHWWHFERARAELFRASDTLDRCLVVSRVGQAAAFTFSPARTVYSEGMVVFPNENEGFFAILQSRPHELWARFFASSLKDDLRYTPEDCFETFPFPAEWEADVALQAAGREYYETRAALMVRHDEGLTSTYNRFHTRDERVPDILRLRELHARMDGAVLAAYGWTDLPTACEFIADYMDEGSDGKPVEKSIRYRWPDAVRDEVLARLLKLNAQRAEEERRSGAAAEKDASKNRPSSKASKKKSAPKPTPLLDRDGG
jgi:hypothetical protein